MVKYSNPEANDPTRDKPHNPQTDTRQLWLDATSDPRILFDAYSPEWDRQAVYDKVLVLEEMRELGVLDGLLRAYAAEYLTRNRAAVESYEAARAEYARAGYCLPGPWIECDCSTRANGTHT